LRRKGRIVRTRNNPFQNRAFEFGRFHRHA
jgi:hypothetical protein